MTSFAMCEFGVKASARSATRKAAPAVMPLSRRGMPAAVRGGTRVVSTESCTPPRRDAAPQRQAVSSDFNAPLVLPGGDNIEVTHQDMSGNSCSLHTSAAARWRVPPCERNTPERGQAAT